MSIRKRDLLGRGSWFATDGRCSTSGMFDEIWHDKNATQEDLNKALGRRPYQTPIIRWYFEEYVKEGRKIVCKTTKTYEQKGGAA